jgi:hypothetical protein
MSMMNQKFYETGFPYFRLLNAIFLNLSALYLNTYAV